MIKFAAQGPETRLDVSQTLPVRELRECHRQILIPARETPMMAVAGITDNALLKLVMGEVSNQLGEHGSTGIHPTIVPLWPPLVFQSIRPVSIQIVFRRNAI